jgi:hypothetical protein
MTPVFHPEAEQEIAAALKVGEERGFGLGRELVQKIRRVSALLFDLPHIAPLAVGVLAKCHSSERRGGRWQPNDLRVLEPLPSGRPNHPNDRPAKRSTTTFNLTHSR